MVSVVVPTHDRAGYLAVTLDSLNAQDIEAPYEVIVVDDGSRDATAGVARRAGVRYVRHDRPRGVNAARNEGFRVASSDLIALVDDDVYAPPEWLRAMVDGAAAHPEAEAFGGPIRARFEGPTPRSCGRELPSSTRRCPLAATRRIGCGDCAPRGARWSTWRPPDSTTAALVTTPAFAP